MKYFPLLLLTFISINAFSQQQIKLEEIKDHVGDSVTIHAKIYGGKYLPSVKGAPTFLNVGGNYPDAPLTLVIWGNARSKLKNAPEDFYKDKNVVIYGKLVLYKEKPEIVISDPKQIE